MSIPKRFDTHHPSVTTVLNKKSKQTKMHQNKASFINQSSVINIQVQSALKRQCNRAICDL